ncbi:MAG: GLPGLI family protein [Saprospirales bacterium]|nr:GLPGLI family protein [Saprospirales bacterium]
MKQLLTLLAFALPLFAFAQNKEGRIVFQESIKLDIQLPEGHEEMAMNLPTSQSFDMALRFNEAASLYENHETEGNPDAGNAEWTGSEGGATIKMIIQRPENILYKNLQEKRKVESREFLGKRFLIKDELDAFQWKITGEQQLILDYPCIKAVYQKEDKTTVAWFTPQIPVSSGPGIYGQLPGMILAVDVNDGERTLTATAIILGETQEEMLKEPTKGKEVTQAEYDQIEADKRKEMEESGDGGIMIKIRN